jgi:hypothetical protein
VFGKARTTLIAPADGVVLSMTTHPAVKPGEPVCQLGLVPTKALARFEKTVRRMDEECPFRRTKRDLASAITLSPVHRALARKERGRA